VPRRTSASIADAVNRASVKGERTVVRRRGKDVAAVVPLADLALLERLEERALLEAAREAMKEAGPDIPWEQLKRELGL